ncbi:MAG TPA: glycoside hydrolase family 44 protein [Candidatus Kapabacteria bacterium]|nr:glycoside hydrolase family 44 protein [Candidatus Kapabacteria bacterium]
MSFQIRTFCLLAAILFSCLTAGAQTPVAISVNTSQDTSRISPLIYGSNGQGGDRAANVTAQRYGGNRLTGYNWENNASNAGSDYYQQSDDYLTWIAGIPANEENVPGIAATTFHDTSLALNCYTIITLPAAGYVAADKNGIVDSSQTAPSSRWRKVQFAKGAAFALTPDTTDGYVYDDEEVNFFVNKYGLSSSKRGVNAYEVDNEPALWPNTHPRIHPLQTTCAEIIGKAATLSKAVKAVDPDAEIFGPVAYGFEEYLTMQNASDWNLYSPHYDWFLSAYLAGLKSASDSAGKRLLDVLDLHWYPEAQGIDLKGTLERIAGNENHDPGVAWARMQAPRTLWDSSYTESSWIGQYFSPVALLPHIIASINNNYPGTKLAFTEFDYGGDHDISGGIATADVLGLFGKYGVYMSSHWGAIGGYTLSAYQIYRNYDLNSGEPLTFGNIHVHAATDHPDIISVYAASEDIADSTLHLIIINKDTAAALDAAITITGKRQYSDGRVWAFDAADSVIKETAPIPTIASNTFHYIVPPTTVCHMVLRLQGASAVAEHLIPSTSSLLASPNPSSGAVNITLPGGIHAGATLFIRNMLGNIVQQWTNIYPNSIIHWDGISGADAIPSGMYNIELTDGRTLTQTRVILLR